MRWQPVREVSPYFGRWKAEQEGVHDHRRDKLRAKGLQRSVIRSKLYYRNHHWAFSILETMGLTKASYVVSNSHLEGELDCPMFSQTNTDIWIPCWQGNGWMLILRKNWVKVIRPQEIQEWLRWEDRRVSNYQVSKWNF